MTLPQEEKLIKEELPTAGWRLLYKFGELLCRVEAREGDLDSMLQDAVFSMGTGLNLDRCLILLWSEEHNQLEIVGEYCAASIKAIGDRKYQLAKRSEFFQLLSEGKPLPLKDIRLDDAKGSGRELERFVKDTESRSVIAFPLMGKGVPLGCISMHYTSENRAFSDTFLELGEMLSQELATCIVVGKSLSERSAEARFFRDVEVPSFVFNRETLRIVHSNLAARRLLSGDQIDLAGMPLLEAMPNGQKIIDAADKVCHDKSLSIVPGILVGGMDSDAQIMDVCVGRITNRRELAVMLYPSAGPQQAKERGRSAQPPVDDPDTEDMVATLSKQLAWERWTRQIACRIHSTLDRDSLLQSVADSLGRALGLSRCMIVRTDGLVSPMVTHEYAEPDISPLGLGRTGQFPTTIVNLFKAKPRYVSDISLEKPPLKLSDDEQEWLSENGFKGILGAPISHHGNTFGVIIGILSGKARNWQSYEMDLFEMAASETAVALTHSQAYLQAKDQLFNMNLLSNLTQQLTNTLELATRTTRSEEREERARADQGAPPLSVRELEVLKLIASGLANREIAQRLFLTESTVELHASRIRKKLKLKSRTALVKFACDNNLV